MDADAAQTWFVAGTIPLLLGGGLHALGTLLDTFRPTFFTPIEPSVKTGMENTSLELLRLARSGGGKPQSMWNLWLGINIGFGLAVFMVGLLCLLIAAHDFSLIEEISAVQPLAVFFSAAFFLISLRFWFYGPRLIAGTATLCFSISAVLAS